MRKNLLFLVCWNQVLSPSSNFDAFEGSVIDTARTARNDRVLRLQCHADGTLLCMVALRSKNLKFPARRGGLPVAFPGIMLSIAPFRPLTSSAATTRACSLSSHRMECRSLICSTAQAARQPFESTAALPRGNQYHVYGDRKKRMEV
ncbi:hypothetical protein ABKN59_008903 [Abortiporus biennis]